MKPVTILPMLLAAVTISACNDKTPKPELENRPPATSGVIAPTPSTTDSPTINPGITKPGDPTQAPLGPNK